MSYNILYGCILENKLDMTKQYRLRKTADIDEKARLKELAERENSVIE
jgi:hypothetical protein